MRAMIAFSGLALVFAVTGCAMNKPSASGKNLTFDCSGATTGWDECTKKADDKCGAGAYTVVSRNIDSAATSSGTSQMKRELVVACK